MPAIRLKLFFLAFFLLGILMICGLEIRAQSISVTGISGSPVCAGNAIAITFATTNGNASGNRFTNSTTFTVYLSNRSGIAPFTSAGTFTTTGVNYSGSPGGVTNSITQTFNIPAATPTGSGYRIFISSTNPIFDGSNGVGLSAPFTVNDKAVLSSSLTPPALCNNSMFSYNPTSLTPGTTFSWTRGLQSGISNARASGLDNPNETLINTSNTAIDVSYTYTLFANNCSNLPQTVIVTVYPSLIPGVIGSDQTVCSNSIPSGLTNVSSPAGGTGTYTYQWQSSADNIVFNNIFGATANSYAPGMLTNTTYFRRIVSSGSCGSSISNVTSIIIKNAGLWTGAFNSDYLNSGNWQCGVVPDLNTNVTIPSGVPNYPIISSAIGNANNLTIQSGASLTVSDGNFKVAGTINIGGTFNAGNGSVELAGSLARNITAATFAGNRVKNLTINNSAGTTLNGILNLSGILKVTIGNFNTSGFITLLSNAVQTAMIDGSGTGTVTGKVTMQAYLPSGFGYKYLSSPFQAATVNELANDANLLAIFPTVYRNDESKNTAGWVNYTNPAGILNPLEGYAVNFGTTVGAKTIDIAGVVNNGSISKTLFNNNNQYTLGFNLVGNPYPSPVNWNLANGWIKTNIDNALYFFKASTTDQYGGTYSSYINGISSDGGISNNIIPAMQGFFVHVSNGTFPISGTLSINNNARINTNASAKILKEGGEKLSSFSSGFKGSDVPGNKTMLRIQASHEDENSSSDPAVIYFEDLASIKFDKDYDALKLMNTDAAVPSLYTISADAQNLSINAIPNSADSTIRIPVGIKTEKSGFIKFNVASLNSLPYSLKVYFLDANTNILHDLRKEPTYSVNLKAGKYENRFSILFSLRDSELQTNPRNAFNAYYSNGTLIYRHSGILDDARASLIISNINGQVLNRTNFIGPSTQKLQIDLFPGIYIITSGTEKTMLHKKIIVH